MKLIKSKLVAALAMVAFSFGAFSFTTTPVYAKETVSTVSYTPLLFQDLPASALQEANAQAAAAALQAALNFAKNVAAGLAGSLLANALSSSEIFESQTYPIDALDP